MMQTTNAPRCVLTIAGSDSGAGAGVQADARAIHALGGFAVMAVTAITAQNTRGVLSWRAEPPAVIAAQIAAVLGTAARRSGKSSRQGWLPIRAVKTGLLPGARAVQAVADALERGPKLPLVVDPVIGSTSGMCFLDASGLRALRDRLLPRAALVTPNWPEAEALIGGKIGRFPQAERAARELVDEHGCAVLVKGGHGPGPICRDCLALPGGRVVWYESPRIRTPNTHGTGCVLSAAIATELAAGRTLIDAVGRARRFLQTSLRRHALVRWEGAGPAFPGS